MAHGDFYPTSGWRTILEAKERNFAALERLIERYRGPILKEIQSRARCNDIEAEELAHEFISVWLRRDFLKNLEERKGRFRSFIKRCITNFLHDCHRKTVNEPDFKIIGQPAHPDGPVLDPADDRAPLDEALDTQWARQVVALALERLEQEFVSARWGSRFQSLKPFLTEPGGVSYASTAEKLGMKEQAVRTAVSRMRARYGRIIEDEIRESVDPNEDWRDELRYFLRLLGGNSVT